MSAAAGDEALASLVLRLLLPVPTAAGSVRISDWGALLELARRNVVLVRLHQALERVGCEVPASFAAAARQESERVAETVGLLGLLDAAARRAGVPFVFSKAFQHYPDMGNDVDLLVLGDPAVIDGVLCSGLFATPLGGSLFNKVAGKSGYVLERFKAPLEIHHGRMGQVGEHRAFAESVIRHRQERAYAGLQTFVPRAEEQLLIQVLQRIYSHLHLRLSDVLHTVQLLRTGGLDTQGVFAAARQLGMSFALKSYLAYVDCVHRRATGAPALPSALAEACSQVATPPRFSGYAYRFRLLPTLTRAYSEKLLSDVRGSNVDGAARVLLLPPLAAVAGVRWAMRRIVPRKSRG